MRRLALVLAAMMVAAAATAADPYFLDRNGVLWKASADRQGLLLTGNRGDEEIVRSLVPFEVGMPGTYDSEIQVASDELTGLVAVVWQRNWTEHVSEIMIALWKGDDWDSIIHLTEGTADNPRYPVITLTRASSTIPDPQNPSDLSLATEIKESFLNVLWWEGEAEEQHASYSFIRLTSLGENNDATVVYNLEKYMILGLGCREPAPSSVLEHPLFATQLDKSHAMIFFGSGRFCMFQLLDVHFELLGSSSDGSGNVREEAPATIAGRRRHAPIFGVKQVFGVPTGMSLEGARVVVGSNLLPVAYRVEGERLEYVIATEKGWSGARVLRIENGLTFDRAIPLVENLAR